MATASNAALLNTLASDADFRTFAQGIHTLITTAGLTQTADTGQANLTTITRPATNVATAYEIFTFNDTEQATLPIYVKVMYGVGGTTARPGLKIQIGTGTDGAGNLNATVSGVLSSTLVWYNADDAVAATQPAFASYANGHFVLAYGISVAQTRGALWVIERPKLQDGSRTTDGVLFWAKGGHSATAVQYFMQVVRPSGPLAQSSTIYNFPAQNSLFGQIDDNMTSDVVSFPIPWAVLGNLRWSALVSYRLTALPGDSTQTISMFGTSRTYRALGNAATNSDIAFAVPFF